MNWLEIYKPICISQIRNNINEIKKAQLWIENYKKDPQNSKKVCLILGTTGVGKTLLANVLFKQYNYDKIELNSSDVRSQRKISDFLKKTLTYRNIIDMFNEGQTPIGILLDEIDTICKLTDKGGLSEFLSILKHNEKCIIYKKNLNDSKNKKKIKQIKIDDYIKLYNPIICTSNDINDKKITELKKYSEVIYLNKPSDEEMMLIIDDIYEKVNQKIDVNVKKYICEQVNGDIRSLVILLEDLYHYSKGEIINIELLNNYKKAFNVKQEDLQLIQSTKLLMIEKMDIKKSQLFFDIDCLLIPLMIYHNSLDYIKKSDDNLKNKINIYKDIMESLCIHDTIQTNIFVAQDWDELYDIAGIYGSSIPNYNFMKLKNKKPIETNVEFTSLLNKISQMYTNRKLLNSSRFSIGKINFDNDEIIYLTEIMAYYFQEYKSSELDPIDDTSNDPSNDPSNDQSNDALNDPSNDALNDPLNDPIDNILNFKDNNDSKENEIIGKYIKPKLNTSNLIKFMNDYNINISGLENILKIDKFNLKNEKRKKKFTTKIKKDITNFLINQDASLINIID